MISFSPDFSNLTKFANLFSNAGGRSTQSFSKVDVHSQTQTGLSIVTAEGDKVTLSTNAEFQGTGVKYNARGVAEGQAISLRSNSLEGSFLSEKQITIEGDLNEQEIQDIKKIVNQANGIREDVAKGDLDTIVANGQQIKATGSIASVDLHIKHSESVSFQKANYQQKPEQAAYPSGAINNIEPTQSAPSPSPLEFLRGLLNSLGNQPPESDESRRVETSNPSQAPTTQSPTGNTSASLPEQGQSAENQTVLGLTKFLDKIGEKILRGAKTIARLANKLNENVERQADKIAQAYKKLSETLANGNEGKAKRLQYKIDRRTESLNETTERFGSRIERATNKLTGLIDRLEDRLTPSESSTSEIPETPVTEPTEPSTPTEPQAEIKTPAEV